MQNLFLTQTERIKYISNYILQKEISTCGFRRRKVKLFKRFKGKIAFGVYVVKLY